MSPLQFEKPFWSEPLPSNPRLQRNAVGFAAVAGEPPAVRCHAMSHAGKQHGTGQEAQAVLEVRVPLDSGNISGRLLAQLARGDPLSHL